MWKGKCYKCGRDIWNGIPQEEMNTPGFDTGAFIAKMKADGFTLGYDTTVAGSFGTMHTVPCKPVCNVCTQEESHAQNVKEKKTAMSKIGKTIKKEFTCPCCFHTVEKGYNTKVFKTASKQDMIAHINDKHDTTEINEVLPYKRE